MKKITRSNYKEVPPEDLMQGSVGGTMGIVETGISAFATIIGYIFQAVGQRKLLRKKVEALEETVRHLVDLNKQMANEIEELKTSQ